MNSKLDSLTEREKQMAYSGSPVNLWLHRLRRKLRIARNEEEVGVKDERDLC